MKQKTKNKKQKMETNANMSMSWRELVDSVIASTLDEVDHGRAWLRWRQHYGEQTDALLHHVYTSNTFPTSETMLSTLRAAPFAVRNDLVHFIGSNYDPLVFRGLPTMPDVIDRIRRRREPLLFALVVALRLARDSGDYEALFKFAKRPDIATAPEPAPSLVTCFQNVYLAYSAAHPGAFHPFGCNTREWHARTKPWAAAVHAPMLPDPPIVFTLPHQKCESLEYT